MSKTHSLKCWSSYWEEIRSGTKTFEVRRNDRDFAVGDTLLLREFNPALGGWGGNYVLDPKKARSDTWEEEAKTLRATVSYILHGGRFGIDATYCVMGLSDVVDETLAVSK